MEFVKKDKFIFGVIVSLVTSIIISAVEIADIIKEDLIFLPITLGLFLVLFTWYARRIAKNDKE